MPAVIPASLMGHGLLAFSSLFLLPRGRNLDSSSRIAFVILDSLWS